MTATTEKQITKAAEGKGYRLEKVGKGPHHGRFALVNKAQGSRAPSGIPGADFTFSLDEAEAFLAARK
jgi:hypothetical protein